MDSSDAESTILASCETIRKIAVVSYPPIDGEKVVPVKDVVAYGIGSVFTPPECRGKGYAKIMLIMLGERLKNHNGEAAGFSVLYSDIGKVRFAPTIFLCCFIYTCVSSSVSTNTPPRIGILR